MASEYGLTTQSDTLNQLIIQDCVIHPLLIDALVPVTHGQVVQYNTTNDNWDAYTSGMAASLYAVIAEARTIGADAFCQCIVKGTVRKSALDTTAKADAEIDIALLKSGIVPQSDAVRTA